MNRTHSVLFRSFRLGRSWKLAFCAYLALCGSLFVPLPLLFPAFPGLRHNALLWLAGTVFTIAMFGFYYLGSRMQFILFDLVVTLDGRIAPLWRLRPASLIWRWIGIKLALTLPLALLVFLPVVPLFRRLFVLLPQAFPPMPAAGGVPVQPSPVAPGILVALFSSYAILIAGMSVLFLASSILSDFALPLLILENASARTALQGALAVFAAEPSRIFGFIAFQILLTILGLLAQYTAALAASLLVAISLGLLALVGYLVLHAILPPALLVAGGVLLYLVFIGCCMYLQLGSFGILMVFLRAYSLLFLGGRYPPLGSLLYASPAAAPPPPPRQPPSASYPPGLPAD